VIRAAPDVEAKLELEGIALEHRGGQGRVAELPLGDLENG
jgi:hypothetical protein